MSQTPHRLVHSALLVVLCLLGRSWAEQQAALQWTTESTNRFVSVHGRRSAIFGYPETGLEVWAYPFQLLKSLTVEFRPSGSTTGTPGRDLLRRTINSPESVTRIYVGPDFVVREKLFVPLDQPGAIVSYSLEAEHPVDVIVHFMPVMDLMWPASIGGQETLWNPAASAYEISEPLHRFTSRIGSPDIASHDDTQNYNRNASLASGVAFTITLQPNKTSRVIVAAGKSETEVGELYQKFIDSNTSLEQDAIEHYSRLNSQLLQIETPDADVNRALQWSEIALDQAWVCNPDLGCAMAAGYGPSRKARRPQYDWFFSGDGMVAIRALLASGDYDRARQELEFILKYQDQKTGMIWHELSQSAGWLDWKSYPYLFLHVDLTFDFLDTVNAYLATTGDLDFIRAHWPSIDSAYEYCRSLINPANGLPQIPSQKRGQREQDELSDELELSASWMRAAKAFATLSAATGHSASTAPSSARLGTTIVHRYWDERQHAWISGYTKSGNPLLLRGAGPVNLLQDLPLSQAQKDATLDELASAHFQTDWGSRGNASNAPNYAPNSYAQGSVWAVSTSGTASAFWNEHRPATAFSVWSALVPWSSLDSLGHMHEALAGDFYREELESVPEQTWSSSAFFTSAVTGLLGLKLDAMNKRLTFAPHLPPDWSSISVRNIRVGGSNLSLSVSQGLGQIRLQAENNGPPLHFIFAPEIPLGANAKSSRLGGQKLTATLQTHAQDAHISVEFDLPQGHSSIYLDWDGGVQVTTARPQPEIGDGSRGVKIISTALRATFYSVDFDYLPSASSTIELHSPWRIDHVDGATVQNRAGGLYELRMAAGNNSGAGTYKRGRVSITFSCNQQK